MANRYGEAALMAARSSAHATPMARWETAVQALYPTSPTAQKKISPRGAFLGLCEQGMVKGIAAGQYRATRDNKDYAIRAVSLLQAGTQSWSTTSLWQAVVEDLRKAHTSQMDVVMALWKNGLIVRGPVPS